MGLMDSISNIGNYITNEVKSFFSSKAEASESNSSILEESKVENSKDQTPSLFTPPDFDAKPKNLCDHVIDGDSRDNELNYARDQIGIVNEKTGLGIAGEIPWCAKFVTDVAKKAGINLDEKVNWDYVPDIYDYANKKGAYSTDIKKAKPGDWVIFNNIPGSANPKSGNDHIGIIEKVYRDGRIVTIEGNTQPNVYSDGCGPKGNIPDQVARKVYSPSDPNYAKIQGYIDLSRLKNMFNCYL